MPWPTLEVKSWAQFTEFAAKLALPDPTSNAYILRGQADESLPLLPSLLRLLPPTATAEQALRVEAIGLKEFKAQAHLHLPLGALPPEMPLAAHSEWWAIMQHYNAPTRLLDWTLSPYVAAYYAVEREPQKPGAIFVAHNRTVSQSYLVQYPGKTVPNEQFIKSDSPATLMVWSPTRKTDRFVAQQGIFTLSVNVLGVHDTMITNACELARQTNTQMLLNEKWVIPASQKLEFLRKLRAMNIAAHSLFPGIDGLGRSLAEVARLAALI